MSKNEIILVELGYEFFLNLNDYISEAKGSFIFIQIDSDAILYGR